MVYINGLVSVIIPVFNGEAYIAKALESALNQSYRTIEIIIVNDGSTDGTSRIIQEYSRRFSNIFSVDLPQNRGVDKARNIGLSMAFGRFVAFLDSDDYWHSNKLEKQLALHERNNAIMSCTALECFDETGRRSLRKVKSEISYNFLLRDTMIATSTVIIDRNLTSDFKIIEPFCGGGDYATWLALLRNGGICYGLNEALTCYRVRRKSLSSNKLESVKQVWTIQTRFEGINCVRAVVNVIFFVMNAILKHSHWS